MKQVDEYAASLHITRTAAVAVLLSMALQMQKSMSTEHPWGVYEGLEIELREPVRTLVARNLLPWALGKGPLYFY